MKKIAALLPMKGYSERVPNKNLKIIAGKPLCLWIIESLLNVPLIDNIVINTDSKKISDLSRYSNKIIIHSRPSRLLGDYVSMNNIIEYDISKHKSDIYLQTHATNPLLKSSTISTAINSFLEKSGKYDSLFSVTRLQTRLYDKNGNAINHNPTQLIRTQDLDPIYEENSNIYIFTESSFSKKKLRIGEKPIMYPIPSLEAIDIDEITDFKMAEYFLQKPGNEK